MYNWRKILWPFVPLYFIGVKCRDLLFDLKLLKRISYDLPVIVVGNLSTGGTGKTPTVEFILKHLHPLSPGFVSRGYGRKTKGLRWLSKDDTAEKIGDEPWQIIQKFPEVKGTVAEKRNLGIQAILQKDSPDYIILDDAFQHKYVQGLLYILLTTWDKPYFQDHLLPAGNLRETKGASNRADIILISKCPSEISKKEKEEFLKSLNARSDQSVFFSRLKYGKLYGQGDSKLLNPGAVVDVLSGIANPHHLITEISKSFTIKKHWDFPDHHRFSQQEIRDLESTTNPIITTEKDWSRLKEKVSDNLKNRIFILPVEIEIMFGEHQVFMDAVKSKIDSSIEA